MRTPSKYRPQRTAARDSMTPCGSANNSAPSPILVPLIINNIPNRILKEVCIISTMNYEEEQKNELEALSEIYFNEIKVISDKAPISFSIKVRPQASNYEEPDAADGDEDGDDDDDDESDGDELEDESDGEENVAQQHEQSVELRFVLPPKYPDEKPSIEILDSNCLEEDELSELMTILSQKAEESLGTVMVFMLVSDVVEWLITKSELEAVEIEQEKEKKQKEIEAEETKRFEGTPVTEQTFLAWKAKFDAEMLKANLEQQKQQRESELAAAAGTKRMTGRAMFETDKTLAESDLNFVEDLDHNQLEALLHNIDEFEIEDDGEDFEVELGDDDDDDDEEDDEDEEFELEEESDEEEVGDSRLKKSSNQVTSKR